MDSLRRLDLASMSPCLATAFNMLEQSKPIPTENFHPVRASVCLLATSFGLQPVSGPTTIRPNRAWCEGQPITVASCQWHRHVSWCSLLSLNSSNLHLMLWLIRSSVVKRHRKWPEHDDSVAVRSLWMEDSSGHDLMPASSPAVNLSVSLSVSLSLPLCSSSPCH